MADLLDVNQFRCSVCLEPFTDPASIPCGHNFCKLCIEGYWDTSELCRCPLCKETFYTRPEVRINCSFREVVNHFKKPAESPPTKDLEATAGDVPCDVCAGVKLKAVKSCLVCLASYCEGHLGPHRTAAALSRHKLSDPVRNLEARICPKHEKIVELYCKEEEAFICRICAETDHSRHQVVTTDVVSQKVMNQIKRKERELDLMIQDRQKRIEEIGRMMKQTNDNAQRQMDVSVKAFTSVMDSIKKTHEDLMEQIERRHDAEQQRFEDLLQELRTEIHQLEDKSIELRRLSHIEDHIGLLEAFRDANSLPPTQNWPSIPVNEVDFLDYIRTSLIRAREFVSAEIRRQEAAELKKVQRFADDVTVNADTAGPWLLVSEDGKEVKQSPKKQRVPTSPARFNEDTFVVASRPFTAGRHYWEVGVEGKANWLLGVASGSLRRNQHVDPCPENGLWTVRRRDGGSCYALTKSPSPLASPSPPQRVGVFVDYEEGQVSFFDVKAQTLMFTFAECDFPGRIYPMFDPCLAPEKKEATPLRIMIVEVTK